MNWIAHHMSQREAARYCTEFLKVLYQNQTGEDLLSPSEKGGA